jgi:hypothetical protein
MVASETVPPLPPYEPKGAIGRVVDRTAKGVCAKCGKYFGRGVNLHKKWCKT